MALLEENVFILKSGKLGLEESLEVYKKCGEYHELCLKILDEVRQKIEVYRPETDSVEDFEE